MIFVTMLPISESAYRLGVGGVRFFLIIVWLSTSQLQSIEVFDYFVVRIDFKMRTSI